MLSKDSVFLERAQIHKHKVRTSETLLISGSDFRTHRREMEKTRSRLAFLPGRHLSHQPLDARMVSLQRALVVLKGLLHPPETRLPHTLAQLT